MTSQRLVEDFAAEMWKRDRERSEPRDRLIQEVQRAAGFDEHDDLALTLKQAEQILDAILPPDMPHDGRTPDNYLNEAAVFLAGELGQRLQHGEAERIAAQLREFASEQPEPSGFAVAGLATTLVGGLKPLSKADIAAGQRVERELGGAS